MSLFPAEMESERLRYEHVSPETLDPLDLYEHVRAGAPHIDEITRYVSLRTPQTGRRLARTVW